MAQFLVNLFFMSLCAYLSFNLGVRTGVREGKIMQMREDNQKLQNANEVITKGFTKPKGNDLKIAQ